MFLIKCRRTFCLMFFEHLECTYNINTLKGKVYLDNKLLFPEECFARQASLIVPFHSADEGIQEKEKPLEKPELSSSPGKGEDKEVKPGEA